MNSLGLFDHVEIVPVEGLVTPLSLGQAVYGSPECKEEFVMRISIDVDDFRRPREFIEALMGRAKRGSQPGGLWILGPGGVGKSHILNDTAHENPPIDTPTSRITPVLVLSFQERPIISTILIQLLMQLGQDPESLHYRKNGYLREQLIDALAESGTLVIGFDEAQHLFLNTGAKRRDDRLGGVLGDFLKSLYDDTSVGYIFTGSPGLHEYYLADSQAKTRWSGLLELKEFEYDSRFAGLLHALDEAIPMPKLSSLAAAERAANIYESTKGNFRLLKNLLSRAVFYAASEDSACIEDKHLALAHHNLFLDAFPCPF